MSRAFASLLHPVVRPMTAKTAFDLIFRRAVTPAFGPRRSISASPPAGSPRSRRGWSREAREIDLDGRLVLSGFVDTHIHLDKACLLGRCGHNHGSVGEAIKAVAAMKRDFTVEDVYQRGARVLERAIVAGTTRMRTHVEIDPRIGLRGFEAIKALKRDYAWAIDLSVCVFPQEGLTNDPGAEELLVAALRDGGEVIGGCPYMDTDPHSASGKAVRPRAGFRRRCRPASRFRSRSLVVASRRGLPPGRAPQLSGPRRHRARHQTVGAAAGRIRRRRGKAGARRRRRHGAARHRPLSDGPRRHPQCAARPDRWRTSSSKEACCARSRPTTCKIRSRRSATPRCCGWRTSTPTSRRPASASSTPASTS